MRRTFTKHYSIVALNVGSLHDAMALVEFALRVGVVFVFFPSSNIAENIFLCS